jgi:hypothetical protein
MKKPVGVQIEGAGYTNNGEDLAHNLFLDAFIEFIESRGWSFGGGTTGGVSGTRYYK